jgi:hypothetical protein
MGEIARSWRERMRLLATSTLLTLSIIAASAGPALANLTPAAEEEVRIENAVWLAGLESWQQTYEIPATETEKRHDLEVKSAPDEIYIIRWYPGN